MTYAHGSTHDDDMPLTSEAECRAAWAYANSDEAASEHSPDELRAMKSRIIAAGKKYGLDLGKVTAAAMLDIEIARPGKWKLASGEIEVTPRMLDDAARFASREGARPGYVKIGHTDTRFLASDGEPALGWVHNYRVEEDERGHVLKADLHDLPDWLASAMPRHWPDRSMEGYADYLHDGEKYGLVVDGLALLGVTPPGMPSIRSLRDLPSALGIPVAAGALEPSGRRIVASFGDSPTSALEAVGPTKKGAGMDPDEIREALGLATDASPDDVRALVDAAFGPPATPVTATAAPGTMLLASSTYEQMQHDIKVLTDQHAEGKRKERDEVIGQAVRAGKFTPAQKLHFSRLWDTDPDGTRTLIDSLTPNSALAVMASGYAGEGVEADAEYAALYGAPDARKAG